MRNTTLIQALSLQQEREFFNLAGTSIACLWKIQGHLIEDLEDPRITKRERLDYALQGYQDYSYEMRLILREALEGFEESLKFYITASKILLPRPVKTIPLMILRLCYIIAQLRGYSTHLRRGGS